MVGEGSTFERVYVFKSCNMTYQNSAFEHVVYFTSQCWNKALKEKVCIWGTFIIHRANIKELYSQRQKKLKGHTQHCTHVFQDYP